MLSFLQMAAGGGGVFLSPTELASAVREHSRAGSGRPRVASSRRASPAFPGKFSLVPFAGEISAGFGDPAEPVSLEAIPVDLEALNIPASGRAFALKVRGDSMIGAQIADGDIVILEVREPRVGDIVAALIDGETTLKRLVSESGQLSLRAENPRYADLIPVRELTIQGVLRAVVRTC